MQVRGFLAVGATAWFVCMCSLPHPLPFRLSHSTHRAVPSAGAQFRGSFKMMIALGNDNHWVIESCTAAYK